MMISHCITIYYTFFRIVWWSESSKEQHLFNIEMFCNSVKDFIATFNQLHYTSWIKYSFVHKKIFWTQNIWTVKSIVYFYVRFLFILNISNWECVPTYLTVNLPSYLVFKIFRITFSVFHACFARCLKHIQNEFIFSLLLRESSENILNISILLILTIAQIKVDGDNNIINN